MQPRSSSVAISLHGPQTASDRRRAPRYDASLKVRIVSRERETIAFTGTVGNGGMFIRTDQPSGLNQIVRMRVALPEAEFEQEVIGLVRWRQTDEEATSQGLPAGMGVTLYQASAATRKQWDIMVQTMKGSMRFEPVEEIDVGRAIARSEPMLQSVELGDAPRRSHRRLLRELTVSWTLQGKLYRNRTRDVGLGGLFLAGPTWVERGTMLPLTLFCPSNHDAFRLTARVVRVEADAELPGMGLDIIEYVDGDIDSFKRFLTPKTLELEWTGEMPEWTVDAIADSPKDVLPAVRAETPPPPPDAAEAEEVRVLTDADLGWADAEPMELTENDLGDIRRLSQPLAVA